MEVDALVLSHVVWVEKDVLLLVRACLRHPHLAHFPPARLVQLWDLLHAGSALQQQLHSFAYLAQAAQFVAMDLVDHPSP
jgi:hypothetical protein